MPCWQQVTGQGHVCALTCDRTPGACSQAGSAADVCGASANALPASPGAVARAPVPAARGAAHCAWASLSSRPGLEDWPRKTSLELKSPACSSSVLTRPAASQDGGKWAATPADLANGRARGSWRSSCPDDVPATRPLPGARPGAGVWAAASAALVSCHFWILPFTLHHLSF